MPVPLIHQYQEEKGVRFVQGYGMTETLRIISLDLEDARRKAGSIGKEMFHTLVRIMDDAGQDVPPEAAGEIIVKGPTVFTRYWNNPDATAAALRDGWFYTGDLGKRDADLRCVGMAGERNFISCSVLKMMAPILFRELFHSASPSTGAPDKSSALDHRRAG